MTSIRNTIVSSLSAEGINLDSYGYGAHVDAAVEALTEREYTLTDQIVERVHEEFGTSVDTLRAELEKIGAAVRPIPEPVVEEEPAAPKSTDEKVDALTEALATLAGTVGKLVTLAETKLGASI
jgi:hypothetical protein